MSDLVGNPEDRFSHASHIISVLRIPHYTSELNTNLSRMVFSDDCTKDPTHTSQLNTDGIKEGVFR